MAAKTKKSNGAATDGVKSQKSGTWATIQSILNTLNHTLIIFVAIFVTLLARSLDFKDTAMHMFLAVVGWHFLAAEALMSHYAHNPVTSKLSHRNKSRFHGILQVIGGSMALLGALGKIQSTEVHFTTWHGKIGLASTFLCAASLLGGTVNFFQPKFAHKIYSQAEIKYRHNLFGIIGFTVAMVTVILGYYTPFFVKYVDNSAIPAFVLASGLVLLFTLIGPVTSLLDKLKHKKKK
ncbi:transmembrane reductase CYB561D2 isoform X2 [Musca domestica]|uniref:ascorbate ferrireductase (transmembrane) n=1 Tax=Musca domestica TaxID=7370 RepID=A0A1I8MF17_MUSDO|nr:transmembrane reductase CYB561D2 isoform X2 [Musca domestica]